MPPKPLIRIERPVVLRTPGDRFLQIGNLRNRDQDSYGTRRTRFPVNQVEFAQLDDHVVSRGRRAEIALTIRLCGRTRIHLGVIVAEREILPLFW